MGKNQFLKVALGIIVFTLSTLARAQVGMLSEGACWFEHKDVLKVASFNDKSVYSANKAQIEAELEALLHEQTPKVNEMDLALHCGGYGASLVAKITTDNNTYCVWSRFEKGKLAIRSIGAVSEANKGRELCDGHKWGEFILGVNSAEFVAELQGPKWSSLIKEVTMVTDKIYKVTLVKDYAFRETEVINQLEENFTGKNFIRYIEFNEYRHPVGEYVPLK